MRQPPTSAVIGAYVAGYIVLTATDVATTLWGVKAGAAQEFNSTVATQAGGLHLESMLMINGAVLTFTALMLVWALGRTDRIDPRYLERPHRAVFNWFYLNPFSSKIQPRSVFHYLAIPLTLLGMKAFATLNNTLIALILPDVVTPWALPLGEAIGPVWAFWVVIVVLFHSLFWPSLIIAAAFVRHLHAADRAPARSPTPA